MDDGSARCNQAYATALRDYMRQEVGEIARELFADAPPECEAVVFSSDGSTVFLPPAPR